MASQHHAVLTQQGAPYPTVQNTGYVAYPMPQTQQSYPMPQPDGISSVYPPYPPPNAAPYHPNITPYPMGTKNITIIAIFFFI